MPAPGQQQPTATGNPRSAPPRSGGGLVAAYLLVLGLIAGSAGLAFGNFEGAAPQVVESAVAASPPAPAPDHVPAAVVESLPLPPRIPPSGFRVFSADERAEMVEMTDDGQRLPRIAPNGWMPWIANARRFDSAGPPARIGILMINVGASEPEMRRAIDDLPPDVSLAFLAGTPDLQRWLMRAREAGHETYLMLATDDAGPVERGIRPIEVGAGSAENLRRLRHALTRGELYAGLVVSSPSRVAESEETMRPLVAEIAERGLALVEVNRTPGTDAIHTLSESLGAGYARSTDVLDYKLAGQGVLANLDRLEAWVGEGTADREPRHAFGVVQPDNETIDAILAWHQRRDRQAVVSFVPIMGHFECRDACMARLRAQPAQLRP